MPEAIWRDPLHVPLLQWLARGSLKQNLLQAVRLWVWLHLLYGEAETRLRLPDPFTYADLRKTFFTDTHPQGDQKPDRHDRTCPCAKVTAAWLWGTRLTLTQPDWETALASDGGQEYQQHSIELERSLQSHHAVPDNLQILLWQTRLFGKTRRTLAGDLQILVKLCCLKRIGQQFYRVNEFPDRPLAVREPDCLSVQGLEFLTQPDLAAIADNLSADINGQRRFFVHLEYVIAPQQLDWVDEWQFQLRDLWQRQPIPPIALSYRGAGGQDASVVVYPVCIYYYQRGPYLCAFRQVPQSDAIDWRNYRLDRIRSIAALRWDDPQVPAVLQQAFHSQTLPTPEAIELAMSEAWGFDYYQPAELLLMRFDREWNDRYIQNTLRHSTFEAVSYWQAGELMAATGKTQLLKLWRARSPHDAYYRALYRQDDPNVRQRLRAWRPHIEILLPWDLRQRMAIEVAQEWQFYRDE